MAIIAKLPDEPNDIGGMTAQQLKEKFDEAGQTIKSYINNTLKNEVATKEELEALEAGVSPDLNAITSFLTGL